VAADVVAGPLQARTVTRGDLAAFDRDMAKLVEKKAGQLAKRVNDIMTGEARNVGLAPEGIGAIWPVIITATSFPHRPEIGPVVRQRLKKLGLLQGKLYRPLAIISAEELAAAEGAIEGGASFLDLLREWKAHANTGDHSFKNFLIDRQPDRRQLPAEHHREMYKEAMNTMTAHVFEDPPASD
jgi:hypothetical protein